MDDLTKKLILQYDDPMVGQRTNAFGMTCDHFAKTGQTWRDRVVQPVEEADALRAENTKLTADVAQYQGENAKLTADLAQHHAAIAQWQKAYAIQQAKLGVASAVAWGRTTGKRIAGYLALPVIALVGWQSYERFSWPSAVDEGLRRFAASEEWRDGYGQPFVRVIAGKPYWVLTFGDTDTSDHATAQGGPIGLHCVHVYAAPAEADFGQYVKVNPYRFGWWLKWPERAVDCKSFSVVAAEQREMDRLIQNAR
jgi:hypothetical protein